jgi:hypothetical protein
MPSRSCSPRVSLARAGFLPLICGREAVLRSIACVAAALGLLALDAPRSQAWASLFDIFGGPDFSYGDYYSHGGEGEHASRRRHSHRSHSARFSEGRRHKLSAWTVASDPQNLSSILHKSPYSTAFPSGTGFSTPLFPRTICVRACDGYSFGRAAAYGGYDASTREAACTAACPDAETKLFVLAPGVDDVAQAKDARLGGSYAQLLAKFRDRETKPATCGCHVASSPSGEAKALLSDPTLRQGDMVVTEKGVKVFLGGGGLPHRTNEFYSLAQTRAVSPAYRGALAAIDKMLKIRPAHERERRP